ncbi:hypothetical protein DS745_11175 [Anaerobacillus alkaliphilus]|uniref:DUF6602 domain-containing protein n=1 Tax=Anaerobacillus alkaliphilus TaxID=1548597 RepID=A0A4Q0VSI0_9BACI|nr:DUF6602 domain-containing protein [Anaerobacillus alkaliphilus]RXJ00620.1 hypothetical protein DS745_11175 [Anaerobacillus alkaliphilus]
MIETYLDLLNQLKEKGISDIEPMLKKVKHPRVIGDMFEGLTKSILNEAIFKEFNLKVVRGFIENTDGNKSEEIDCMIVEGEGEKIAFTEDYFWKLEKVIAVVQVKKNLHGKDLKEGFENLQSVYKISEPKENWEFDLLKDSYENLFNEEIPYFNDVSKFPFHKQLVYHTLIKEVLLPPRIIFGYSGFKSEANLRKSIMDHLSQNIMVKNHSVASMPNLILCGEFSLIKMNGIPFNGKIDSDNYWHFYGSYNEAPLLLLLEILWTRLAYKYKISPKIFGEDSTLQLIRPLIKAKGVEKPSKGWLMQEIKFSRKQLSQMKNKVTKS